MTLDELKQFFQAQDLPSELQIGPDMVVTEVDQFLRISFLVAEAWTRDLEKCPEYLRLIKFKQALEAR
ncbi:DUF6965 family protein [Sphingobacterium sp. SYP-B4668]|uniref:DUF6965 family protein n=1 Tax=Sphingobacterium sp. SYP-B4668 TaxID=2996035 RepID=UPI0005326238|nr:hypothetical protein [Sphingobacterium sp. SYP-B4668]